MAKDIFDLASKVAAKAGFTAAVSSSSSMTVTKAGQTFVARVLHNVANNTVTVGDGSGVKTGDADAWLNELK